jgi:hypothetical protein
MKHLFLLLTAAFSAHAVDILNVSGKVMVVDFTSKRVELIVPNYRGVASDTRVCLQGKTQTKQILDLKCGKIVSVDKQRVLVEVTKGGLEFKLGEIVTVLTENHSVGQERMLASYYDNLTGQMPARTGLAAGMTFGLNYFFPSVHLEFAVSPSVTLGVLGIYGDSQSNNSRNKTYGGLASVTYYTPQPSLGLNFELLFGAYNSNVSYGAVGEEITSIAVAGLVGWKGYLSEQFHYRLNLGAQYISNQTTPKYLDFANVLPFFRAEVGVSF